MAGHGLQRYALGDESADPLQGDDLFKLDAVAKGAAGGDDRVDQFQTRQRNSHIGFHARQSSFFRGQGSGIRGQTTLIPLPADDEVSTFRQQA